MERNLLQAWKCAREAKETFELVIDAAPMELVEQHGRGMVMVIPMADNNWPIPARTLCAAVWIAAVATLLTTTAIAETLVHLSRPVWGCVDFNEAGHINDNSNPMKSDPEWIARTVADGQCVMLGSVSQWATLSENHEGLTYVGRRGGIGQAGSFWVPTSALVIETQPD